MRGPCPRCRRPARHQGQAARGTARGRRPTPRRGTGRPRGGRSRGRGGSATIARARVRGRGSRPGGRLPRERSSIAAISACEWPNASRRTYTTRSSGDRVSSTTSRPYETVSATRTPVAGSPAMSTGSGSHSPTYASRRAAIRRRRSRASREVIVTRKAPGSRTSSRGSEDQRSHASCTTSSASETWPSIRYATATMRGRLSSKAVCAGVSVTGGGTRLAGRFVTSPSGYRWHASPAPGGDHRSAFDPRRFGRVRLRSGGSQEVPALAIVTPAELRARPPRSRPRTSTASGRHSGRRRCSRPRRTTTRPSTTGSARRSSSATGSPSGRAEEVAEPGSLRPARHPGRERHRRPRPGRRDPRLPQRLPPPRHRGRRSASAASRPLPVPVPRLDLRPRRHAQPRHAHRGPRATSLRDFGLVPVRCEHVGRASSS